MKIQNVADDAFRRYGKVLEGYDFTELLKEMKHTPVPEDVIYVPSVEEMEALPVAKELQNKGYGGLPIEIGYCNGHNKKLNGLEYHRNSEINVARNMKAGIRRETVNDLLPFIQGQDDSFPWLFFNLGKLYILHWVGCDVVHRFNCIIQCCTEYG